MKSTGGEGVCQGGRGGGGIKVLKGMGICARHTEVCGGWERDGRCASAPEVAGVAARWELKEARPKGEVIL